MAIDEFGEVQMDTTMQEKAAEFTREFGENTKKLFEILDRNLESESKGFSGDWAKKFAQVRVDVMENARLIVNQLYLMDEKMKDAAVKVAQTNEDASQTLGNLPGKLAGKTVLST